MAKHKAQIHLDKREKFKTTASPLFHFWKKGKRMIQVSKSEARLIRQHLPQAHLKRTVNRYYAEETAAVLEILGATGKRKNKTAKK